ncbi:unnamed protein product [Closterium sp. NIES-54]
MNPSPVYITLYFIVTRLRDSLHAPRDHFLALDPTDLTVDLLEKHLLAAETGVVAVGAARGTPRTPFFEGCPPSPLAPSYTSAAAVDILGAEDVGAASAIGGKRRNSKGKGGTSGGGGSGGGGGGSSGSGGGSGGGGSSGSGGGSGGFGGGSGGTGGGGGSGDTGSGGSRVGARGASGGSVRCLYVIRTGDRAGQTCEKPHSQHRFFSRLDDAWLAEFGDEAGRPRWAELLRSGVDIFALDYDAILAAMYALSVSAEGDCYLCVPPNPDIEAATLGASEFSLPGTALAAALHTFILDSGASRCFFHDILACYSNVLPCQAVPSGSLLGLHLPSFSTNLVSIAALKDAMVTTTTLGGPVAPPYSCRLLSQQNLLWHHCLGHPPFHAFVACTFASFFLVFLGLCLPSRPCLPRPAFLASRGSNAPLLAPPCFPRRLLPVQTLHMDVWGPARISGQGRERYFLLDLPVLHLHSDRGGEFSSDLLRDYCRGEGILQSFMLPASPQKNGIAERRIGLVMEVAGTSMIHVAAPHFLWSFAVWYAAHQLNLLLRVSLPQTSPTLRWMGKVGNASVFGIWGSRAFVRDTSTAKLSAHAIP